MTLFDMLYNPWIAAIIGGTIAPVIGGLILADKGKFDSSRGPGAIVIIARLLLYAAICAGLGGLLFGVLEPGFFSFSIQELGIAIPELDTFIRIYLFIVSAGDIIIRICLFIFCAGGIFLAMFFNISIYDLMER